MNKSIINEIMNYEASTDSEELGLLYSALEFSNPFAVSFLENRNTRLLEIYWEINKEYTKQKRENMKYELEPTQLNVVLEKKEEKKGSIIMPEKKSGWVEGTVLKKGSLVPNSIKVDDECLFKIEQAVEFDGKYIINCKMIVLE